MKRLLICLISLFGLISVGQAQITHSSQGNLDENATTVLQKAAKKLRNITGKVTLTVLDSQKKQVSKQQAKVSYVKGCYRVVTDNMEVVCNGTTIWQWNKDVNEIVINNMPPEGEINLLDPARLLQNYNKSFRAKYIRTEDDGTAVIDLQPRSAQNYHKIRLLVNEETGMLKRIEVHKYDSGRELYDFSELKYGILKANFNFRTEEHPGAEIIDMR